jgi:predicted nucleotide-binding protein (sugar kinase/HSP70/actin superfamily)
MTLSVGKAVCYHHQGCDGVVDVSPFTCMNGIVTEAVYPRVSADHDDMPIRNAYFDGVRANLDRDLDVFMELARSYRGRKTARRGSGARRTGSSPPADRPAAGTSLSDPLKMG